MWIYDNDNEKIIKENATNSQRKRHSCNMQHGMAVNPNRDARAVVLVRPSGSVFYILSLFTRNYASAFYVNDNEK